MILHFKNHEKNNNNPDAVTCSRITHTTYIHVYEVLLFKIEYDYDEHNPTGPSIPIFFLHF